MPRDVLSAALGNVGHTPQSQPLPDEPNQVRNAAGGYVFRKDEWTQLEDFLCLGTTGNTLHITEDKLTTGNMTLVLKLAKENGAEVVRRAVAISTAIPPRAPKNRGCLFALAAVSALGDPEAVQAVKAALPEVARTTDHLSQFFGYRKQLKSKPIPGGKTAIVSSRAFRSTLESWFYTDEADSIAFKVCKARQRKTPAGEAFDLRDVLRIAKPHTAVPERRALFGWIAGNVTDEQAAELLPTVARYCQAKAVKTPAEAIRVVTELRVPWEFLPSEVLADRGVWEALASTVGITALIRNLARMTRIGAIAPLSDTTRTVTRRLVNAEALAKGRIHPMDVYLALKVYASGRAQPNPKADVQAWTPVTDILDALEEAYELSFGHVEPSGRKLLGCVDSSGSMGWGQVTLNGSPLGKAYQVANGIMLTMKRIEGESLHVIDVDTQVHRSKITKRTRLGELQSAGANGGGTDMSLQFGYATQYDLIVDGFFTLTDNETWAGKRHPVEAFDAYRRRYNPAARNVVATMVPSGYGIADPSDPATLQVAGLDASLPQVLTAFIRGNG
jgi:60 kDa SS-A/Ro ribonucleoprotein